METNPAYPLEPETKTELTGGKSVTTASPKVSHTWVVRNILRRFDEYLEPVSIGGTRRSDEIFCRQARRKNAGILLEDVFEDVVEPFVPPEGEGEDNGE